MSQTALILAAGEGKRMKSAKPKVAHELLGKPLIRWVVDAAAAAGCDDIVCVLGHGIDDVAPLVTDTKVAVQAEQLGTGHAVMCAREQLADAAAAGASIVVLSGDSPLIRPETIRELLVAREERGCAAAVLTMEPPETAGYGRVIREGAGDLIARIVEDRDCSPEEKLVCECNSGIYCFDASWLLSSLDALTADNAQQEYYLTDMIAVARAAGKDAIAVPCADFTEALGINSRRQLAYLTKLMQHRINDAHMDAGVTMTDPDLVWIGPDVEIAPDVELLPLTFLMGKTSIASGCVIGPNTRITDCTIGQGCRIDETVAIESVLDDKVKSGPRAYLRPKTHMCEGSKAGTSVEIKKSTIGKGSKVPHLSYIGDTTMGEGINIGAGTITCNYDGHSKFPTTIGDHSFVGSDTMLVAPVNVGADVLIGAGSTITKDVPDGALAIARERQTNIEGWVYKHEHKDEK